MTLANQAARAAAAAKKDAAAYLADCGAEQRRPDNDVSAFGGWDGWAIEGMGIRDFAKSVVPCISESDLQRIEDGGKVQSFIRASAAYHKEFSRIVQAAIEKEEAE